MNGAADPYSVLAKYYDRAYGAMKDLIDVPFYVELALKIGGPVLELGCGTGRVLIPIARAGIAIDGVDISTAMLRILRQNIEGEANEVRGRIDSLQEDMRTLHLERKYPLVILPFRPLQHMHSIEDQLRALHSAASHLEPAGILVFDVFYPNFEKLHSRIGEEILEIEWEDTAGCVLRRYYRKNALDKVRQILSLTFLLRTYKDENLIREEEESFNLSYYTYPHLRALFLLAELEIVEEYGSFAKTPLDNTATDMIFLLRRKTGESRRLG